MSITLWGRDSSANVQKVRWALAELGLTYEHIPLGGKYGGNREPEYLALNPNGLVPTLRDGDLIVWESHAVVRYLAATYGSGSLWPESPTARAHVDQWTDWTASTFQPAWLGVFWKFYRTPPDRRDAAAIEAAMTAAERCFAIMDRRLSETPFLGGPQLTYADISAGVAMFRWTNMGIERQHHAGVEAWVERLRARDAYRTTVELDFSEFAGRLAY